MVRTSDVPAAYIEEVAATVEKGCECVGVNAWV